MRKKCSTCGESKPTSEFWRNRGRKDGLSSMCIPCDSEYKKKYRPSKEQHRLSVARYRKEHPIRNIVNTIRSRSKTDGLEFDLDAEFLRSIMPTHCPILGIELFFGGSFAGRDNTPSVDRVDPQGGYTKDNVQIISHRANRIKNDASMQELIAIGRWAERQEESGGEMGSTAVKAQREAAGLQFESGHLHQ